MPIDLTDADRAVLKAELGKLYDSVVRLPPGWEAIYRAGLAAGRARAIKEYRPVIEAAKAMDEQAGHSTYFPVELTRKLRKALAALAELEKP